jgi:hypothetical protein
MKNLILGYERGKNKWSNLNRSLELAGQECTIVTNDRNKIIGPYDRIWSMAESLLPLQAKLEKEWGIKNVSVESANILTNKKKFDDFCIQCGLESFIPYSTIPTNLSDLDYFNNKPFIIKPVIGSGTKQNYDTNIAYFSYRNKNDFMKRVPVDLLFYTNQKGFTDPDFNNVTNYYMAQEHLNHPMVYAPYGYVNEYGEYRHIFTIVGKCIDNQIDDLTFESKPTNWFSVPDIDLPPAVIKWRDYFFNTIIDELQIKSMFFAGPDFYYDGRYDIKIIDCNPRLGGGLTLMNELHNGNLVKQAICNEQLEINTQFYWVNADLKPGKIKEVGDINWLEPYMANTSKKIEPGQNIPKFAFNTLDVKDEAKIIFVIPGKEKSDMINTYRTLNEKLQSCISYY